MHVAGVAWHAVLCHAMPCHVMACSALPCTSHAKCQPCHAAPCHAIPARDVCWAHSKQPVRAKHAMQANRCCSFLHPCSHLVILAHSRHVICSQVGQPASRLIISIFQVATHISGLLLNGLLCRVQGLQAGGR